MSEIYTTGQKLKEYHACVPSIVKFKETFPNYTDKTKVPILQIIEVNGLEDAVWALRAIAGKKRAMEIPLRFAIACAEHILHIFENEYPNDGRSRRAIEAAKIVLHHNTKENRRIARAAAEAARAAAYSAAFAAEAAHSAADAAEAVRVAFAADSAAYSAFAAADAVRVADAAFATYSAHSAAFAAEAADAADAAAEAADAVRVADAAERHWQEKELIKILRSYDGEK